MSLYQVFTSCTLFIFFICKKLLYFVRNPSGYTQRRLGIQGSMTFSPTRITLLAVCYRVLLRFANSPFHLRGYSCLIGLQGYAIPTQLLPASFLTATLEFAPICQVPLPAVLAYEMASLFWLA
jgi:hypothetical protein